MDAGKVAVEGLMFILIFNFALFYLNEIGVAPLTPINAMIAPTDISGDPSLNATTAAEAYAQGTIGIVSYFLANIVPVLQIVARLVAISLIGLPAFLIAIGCPLALTTVLTAIYSVVWVLALAEIIRGLKFSQ